MRTSDVLAQENMAFEHINTGEQLSYHRILVFGD